MMPALSYNRAVRLTHLSLSNFRNYLQLDWEPPAGPIILQGANAQGKTNLLEAIYYLATGSSPRTASDRELIHWRVQGPLSYARLMGQVGSDPLVRMEIVLIKGPAEAEETRKEVRINGSKRRALELWGHLKVVLFLPEDVDLLAGPPAPRRRYLDKAISQLDPDYVHTLAEYERVLTRRNHLLRRLRDRGGDPQQLEFWDSTLAALAAAVLSRRQRTVNEWDESTRAIHLELTGGQEKLTLAYKTTIEAARPDGGRMGEEELAVRFLRRLELLRREEVERGQTLIGPHRDDLRAVANGVDLIDYGSRGQQRTAALALKLAEAELIARASGEVPLLLLDDILSELDEVRRHYLLASLARAEQIFITTTEVGAFLERSLESARLYHVREGSVTFP